MSLDLNKYDEKNEDLWQKEQNCQELLRRVESLERQVDYLHKKNEEFQLHVNELLDRQRLKLDLDRKEFELNLKIQELKFNKFNSLGKNISYILLSFFIIIALLFANSFENEALKKSALESIVHMHNYGQTLGLPSPQLPNPGQQIIVPTVQEASAPK